MNSKLVFLLISVVVGMFTATYKQTITASIANQQQIKKTEASIAQIYEKREQERIADEAKQAEQAAAQSHQSAPAIVSTGHNGLPCGVKATGYSPEQWRATVAKYFPSDQVNNALAIMQAESGGDPGVKSCTADHGLMQVNLDSHFPKIGCAVLAGCSPAPLYDPATNLQVAALISGNGRNWCPWTTSHKLGLCLL